MYHVYHIPHIIMSTICQDPSNERGAKNLKHYENMIQAQNLSEEMKYQRNLADYQFSKDYSDYEKLCRGEKTHVRCFNDLKKIPSWLI